MISAIGKNVDENWKSLKACASGISKIELLKTVHTDKFPSGEIKLSHDELKALLNISDPYITRTAMLGMIAVQEALANSSIEDINAWRTGLVSSTTVAGMDRSELYYEDFFKGKNTGYISTHYCGYTTDVIADFNGISKHITTMSTACSSSANAIMYGARLIKNGVLDRVVVGGTDALSVFTLNGFNSLLILDGKPCTPFDQNRQGLNLGEGAGYLVLESEECMQKSGKPAWGLVQGYANANDAYHQTASSPEGNGATLAMEQAIKMSGLKLEDIDYINVHGTGTSNNDASESMALQNIFGDNPPPFSTTKAYTGHTLAAAGAIESIYCLLAMKYGVIYPTLRHKEPIEEFSFSPETTLTEDVEINNTLTNSFGFGGNNTTLIFSKQGV